MIFSKIQLSKFTHFNISFQILNSTNADIYHFFAFSAFRAIILFKMF